MNYREAQKLARQAGHDFGLPKNTTLRFIHNKLEARRGRTIDIVEVPGLTGADVCGLWFVFEDHDVVLLSPAKSSWHRQAIILHEFSHMILRHDLGRTEPNEIARLLPDLAHEHVVRAFTRGSYGTERELTAEVLADQLATLILNGEDTDPPEPLAFREVFG